MLDLKPLAMATALAGVLGASLPAAAQGNWNPGDFGSLRTRIGYFEPNGDDDYWDAKETDWTGAPDDLAGVTFGFDYHWPVARNGGLLLGFGFYEGDTSQAYRDWVDENGHGIWHSTELETFELTATWVQHLLPRSRHPSPYLGVGAGLVFWGLTEHGDFLDFSGDATAPEIFHGAYESDGTTYQLQALAGVDFPLGGATGMFLEARYRWADDTLDQDFAGFGSLDLSGLELTAGMSFNF